MEKESKGKLSLPHWRGLIVSGTDHTAVDFDAIRKFAAEAEALGRLHEEQLKIIHLKRWLHLFVPKEYGGLELSLPQAVRLEERIAYADGSVGWVVTLCAGAAMFIGYFDKQLADDVFSDEQVWLAGSGHVNGTAIPRENGYLVNGTWPYASGAPHATWFTANCVVGNTVQSFVFKRNEITLHPSWKYIGLNATAGYSYSAANLLVPANRAFRIDAAHVVLPQPVYKYPFLQLAETTIAANLSGMCMYFVDLASELLSAKEPKYERAETVKTTGLKIAKEATEEIERLRQEFYAALDGSWEAHTAGGSISETTLKKVSDTSLLLARRTRELVNQLYPYCGLEAARQESTINQVWRNINTASQHTLLLKA